MAKDDWGFGGTSEPSFDFDMTQTPENGRANAASGSEWNIFSAPQQAPVQQNGVNLNAGFLPEQGKQEKRKGPWHWLLTLVALLIVGGLSFGMSYLTRDIRQRNVLLIGLHFMVPLAAMMLTALFLEHRTSAMTPNASRKKQLLVALAAVMLTFGVGCVSDLVYLQGFVTKMPAQQETITVVKSNNIIFLMDKSYSMAGTYDRESQQAVRDILDTMPDNACVGLVLFGTDVLDTTPIQPLTAAHRQDLRLRVAREANSGTNFDRPIEQALQMYARNMPTNGYPNQIVMIMDGTDSVSRWRNFAQEAQRLGVTISTISVGGTRIQQDMHSLVSQTGGVAYATNNYEELRAHITEMAAVQEQVVQLEVEDRDLLRSVHPTAVTISGVMLVLEGLVIGLCLWLMLSVYGQFRVQVVLSPLFAALTFVVLKILPSKGMVEYNWIMEGAAFTLLGIVFMRKNRNLKEEDKHPHGQDGVQQPPVNVPDIDFF